MKAGGCAHGGLSALLPLLVATAVGCAPLYGARFDFPQEPLLPDGAMEVTSDTGADDDDPMRSRQVVADIDDEAALIPFYRASFPSSDGWQELTGEAPQKLCLLNTNDDRYIELIEVFEYTGARVEQRPGRYLVTSSRFAEEWDDMPCGTALRWVDSDLL